MYKPELELERLKRHYDACRNGYDPVSLLDLAHSLRVVSEYKKELNRVTRRKKPILLPHCRIPTRVKKLMRGGRFLMALFPTMVELKNTAVTEVTMFFRCLSDSEIKSIPDRDQWPIKELGVSDWLGADAVIWRLKDNERQRNLSRERIIKRVANYLGGSHAAQRGKGNPSVDDETLQELMSWKCEDIPLPYVMVMSIAQELLRALGYLQKSPHRGR